MKTLDKELRKKFSQKIGDRLRKARFRKGYLQEEIAKMLGMSAVGYGSYERGDNDIPTFIIYQLLKILDISADWLFRDENNDTD